MTKLCDDDMLARYFFGHLTEKYKFQEQKKLQKTEMNALQFEKIQSRCHNGIERMQSVEYFLTPLAQYIDTLANVLEEKDQAQIQAIQMKIIYIQSSLQELLHENIPAEDFGNI